MGGGRNGVDVWPGGGTSAKKKKLKCNELEGTQILYTYIFLGGGAGVFLSCVVNIITLNDSSPQTEARPLCKSSSHLVSQSSQHYIYIYIYISNLGLLFQDADANEETTKLCKSLFVFLICIDSIPMETGTILFALRPSIVNGHWHRHHH